MSRFEDVESRFLKRAKRSKINIHKDDGVYKHLELIPRSDPDDCRDMGFHVYVWPDRILCEDHGFLFQVIKGCKFSAFYFCLDMNTLRTDKVTPEFVKTLHNRLSNSIKGQESIGSSEEKMCLEAEKWATGAVDSGKLSASKMLDLIRELSSENGPFNKVSVIEKYYLEAYPSNHDCWDRFYNQSLDYTPSFLGACHALAHTIKLYDAHKAREAA